MKKQVTKLHGHGMCPMFKKYFSHKISRKVGEVA